MLAPMPPRGSHPPIRTIASRQHPLVATCRALAKGDDRSRMLLDGAHLVAEALEADVRLETVVFSEQAWTDERPELEALRPRALASGATVVRAAAAVLDAMSPVRRPSGVLGIAHRPRRALPAASPTSIPMLVIVVDVQDPGNLGAIVRAAEAGGATGVLVTGASADPFSWKALRGSMGSALRVPVIQLASVDGALAAARGLGCRVLATTPHGGEPFTEVSLAGPVAFLLGGEGPGLGADVVGAADASIAIPMAAPVESLNVAVAAALLVFEARRQRQHT